MEQSSITLLRTCKRIANDMDANGVLLEGDLVQQNN